MYYSSGYQLLLIKAAVWRECSAILRMKELSVEILFLLVIVLKKMGGALFSYR